MATTPSATASGSTAPGPPTVQEFTVRVPKVDKPTAIMRFNGALNVDIGKWANVKMIRDDHSSKPRPATSTAPDPMVEVEPKFGAGSEYGREAREEARRRKYGGRKKTINEEDQPWVLKAVTTDKQTKRFKGLREGTISENASYFIFTQATDGQFEAFPVSQWYNFTPIQTYKSLTAEEAEEEFGRRDKIMNYFNVMVRKKARGDDGDDGDKDDEKPGKRGKGGKGGGGGGDLKVSEMEDWEDMRGNESDDDDDDEDGEKKAKVKKPGKKGAKGKKKGSGSEAEEDSDDGDGEGRELDYISDTSASESENEEEGGRKEDDLVGVDQESGLRDLLESGSEDEEEKKETKQKDEDEDGDADKPKKAKAGKSKKPKKKVEGKSGDNLSDDSDIEDEGEESDPTKGGAVSDKEKTTAMEVSEASEDRKRKAKDSVGNSQATKKPKMEIDSVLMQTAAAEGITEEAVRRYLLRKPMTASELLQKFKSKKAKVSSEDLVPIIASILKKINPEKRTQNGKMYLYLKTVN